MCAHPDAAVAAQGVRVTAEAQRQLFAMQFHDQLAQRLQHVRDALGDLHDALAAPNAPSAAVLLAAIRARYTMEDERRLSTCCSGTFRAHRRPIPTAIMKPCAAVWSSSSAMTDSTSKTSTMMRLGRLAPDASEPLPALPRFEHVMRYWDKDHGCYAARVLPGEYYVTRHPEGICTVLGSCVSACIRDERLNIGGMNHFMLPLDGSNGGSSWSAAASAATRYGNVAMERLINEILKLGGRREDLEIKLVGGGRVLSEMANDVGARNIEFVRPVRAR